MIDTCTAPYAATLLRVSLGVMFLAHGLLLKVFIFTVPGTVQFFQSIGYPALFAYLHQASDVLHRAIGEIERGQAPDLSALLTEVDLPATPQVPAATG